MVNSFNYSLQITSYIDKFVAPGSYIMTDGLASYGRLENWDEKQFQHDVVLHKYYFVDPENVFEMAHFKICTIKTIDIDISLRLPNDKSTILVVQ